MRAAAERRPSLPFLERQFLKGPAIAVRVGEGRAGDCGLAGRGHVLDPTDVHSAFDQLLARGMDVIDDQMQALDQGRRRVDHPDAEGDGDGAG
jgi:hypothetical protein